jgi:hypothetical protein
VDLARVGWDANSMHTKNDIDWATIVNLIHSTGPVIANVMAGKHFVLVVGWVMCSASFFRVNCPNSSVCSCPVTI